MDTVAILKNIENQINTVIKPIIDEQKEVMDSDEIIKLKQLLKVETLKYQILQTKSAYSSLKQSMNQTDGKEDKTLPVEEF